MSFLGLILGMKHILILEKTNCIIRFFFVLKNSCEQIQNFKVNFFEFAATILFKFFFINIKLQIAEDFELW